MFGKLAEIKLLLKGLAKESAIAVDNNVIESQLQQWHGDTRDTRPAADMMNFFGLVSSIVS
jgi:hypothetical protein